MKKLNIKSFLSGLLVGGIVATSIGAYATGNQVIANIASDFNFKFNGIYKMSGDDILVYKGKSYVPARFVGESLGAEVSWDEQTKTASFKLEPKVVEKEVIKEVVKEVPCPTNPDGTTGQVTYSSLPVDKTYKDFKITLSSIVRYDDETRLYITLDNKESNDAINISSYDTKVTIDGKEYLTKDVPLYRMDQNLFNGVNKGKVLDGYLLIPSIPEDAKNMTVYVKLYRNGSTKEEFEINFNVKR